MIRNARFNVVGLIGCAGLVLVMAGPAALAAEPASGTASAGGDELAWEGGPFTSVNISTGTCVESATCDTFTLNLAIPEGKVARVNFAIHWQDSNNDFDLFVFDQQGNQLGSSAAGGTESEQVAIEGLSPGTYEVVTNAFATVNASYQGGITLLDIAESPTPATPGVSETIRFGDETLVDFGSGSGEPFIRTDNEGNVFNTVPFGLSTTISLLWKSLDGARTWIPLGTQLIRDSVIGLGGGDSHVDFDAENRLYFVDLSGACVTVAVSLDGGNTFPPERTNQFVCVSEQNPAAIGDDRQWVGAFGDGIGYVTFRNLLSGGFWLFKSDDAGLTWDGGRQLGSVSQSGAFEVDKQKRFVTVTDAAGNERSGEAILSYQVFYRGTDLRVFRVVDFDDATPLIVDDLRIFFSNGSKNNVFPHLAIDRAGNIYGVWSEGASNIFMASSTDFGATWSAPHQVNTTDGTNIMPWIAAGDAGRLNIVWYHGSLPGNPNVPENVWDIRMAQSLNALNDNPSFTQTKANQTFIKRGQICLSGLACDIAGADRSFLEFPSLTTGLDGAAIVTYNRNTNQIPVTYVMSSRQISGPSLFESVGEIGTDPGEVSIESPAAGQSIEEPAGFVARGTHELPPANFDLDEAGDARFPDHGPVIGENIPALDIRSVSVSDDAEALIFSMEIADLSGLATAAVESGGDGVAYVVQWQFGEEIFWTGAEVRGGVPVFHKGVIGALSTTLNNPKYYTFRPEPADSLSVQGAIEGNTIRVRVPRNLIGDPRDGDTLFQVTGYALSQRAPFTPDVGVLSERDAANLPIQVDAAGAFAYTVGNGPRHAGIVQVALNDPGFESFRKATLVNPTGGDNRWEAALGELEPGAHTLFVRQQIDGREASPVVSVDFEVPATVERVVNEMVRLITANPSFSGGTAAFDLFLENVSDTSIFTPLRAEVVEINSTSGEVTAANADNGLTGPGAFWSYDDHVGGDNELSPNEISGARRLAFANNGEPFSVLLDVIGQLPREGFSGTNAGSGGNGGGGGADSTASGGGSLEDPVQIIFEITVNPLLGIVRVEVIDLGDLL